MTREQYTLNQYYPAEAGIYAGQMPARGVLGAYNLFAGQQEEIMTYGPNELIDGASDHWDGLANTRALVASGLPHLAAAWCMEREIDGRTDFYLPAHAELCLAWINCAGAFRFSAESYYWSSTHGGRGLAWVQAFEDGSSGYSSKSYARRVRPFRRSFI